MSTSTTPPATATATAIASMTTSFTQPSQFQSATQQSQSQSQNQMSTATATATQPPLPPAHLFDILPSLHALLSRLEPSLNSYTAPTSNALDPSSSSTDNNNNNSISTPNPSSSFPAASASASASASANNNNGFATVAHQHQHQHQQHQDLGYKDTVTASQYLKARMRRAMAELGKLGDMDRTVLEQEDEIRELEGRIERQRAVLGGLGGSAARGFVG